MGALEKVEILGTPLEAIYKGEDREKFRDLMTGIGEPVPGVPLSIHPASSMKLSG